MKFIYSFNFSYFNTVISINVKIKAKTGATAQTVKKQRVSVSINENLEYYIDKERVELKYIEAELIEKLAGQEEQVVVLRVDKAVAIEHAVAVMDIAYRNKFKIVLATQQKK